MFFFRLPEKILNVLHWISLNPHVPESTRLIIVAIPMNCVTRTIFLLIHMPPTTFQENKIHWKCSPKWLQFRQFQYSVKITRQFQNTIKITRQFQSSIKITDASNRIFSELSHRHEHVSYHTIFIFQEKIKFSFTCSPRSDVAGSHFFEKLFQTKNTRTNLNYFEKFIEFNCNKVKIEKIEQNETID